MNSQGRAAARYALLLTTILSLALGPIQTSAAATAAQADEPRDSWSTAEPEWAQPGPYRWPLQQDFSLQSFGADQRIVGNYFFYWFLADLYRQRAEQRASDPNSYRP